MSVRLSEPHVLSSVESSGVTDEVELLGVVVSGSAVVDDTGRSMQTTSLPLHEHPLSVH